MRKFFSSTKSQKLRGAIVPATQPLPNNYSREPTYGAHYLTNPKLFSDFYKNSSLLKQQETFFTDLTVYVIRLNTVTPVQLCNLFQAIDKLQIAKKLISFLSPEEKSSEEEKEQQKEKFIDQIQIIAAEKPYTDDAQAIQNLQNKLQGLFFKENISYTFKGKVTSEEIREIIESFLPKSKTPLSEAFSPKEDYMQEIEPDEDYTQLLMTTKLI